MYFYLVNKIGDGNKKNPYRPNYEGSFVWSPNHICLHCSTYIIGLSEETELLQPVENLETACNSRSLPINEVITWFVGDN
jgi:hypothetical protein